MNTIAPVVCGLIVAALVIALAVRVARRAARPRYYRWDTEAETPPVRHETATVTVLARPPVQPSSEMTGPFAYDNGVLVDNPEESP